MDIYTSQDFLAHNTQKCFGGRRSPLTTALLDSLSGFLERCYSLIFICNKGRDREKWKWNEDKGWEKLDRTKFWSKINALAHI